MKKIIFLISLSLFSFYLYGCSSPTLTRHQLLANNPQWDESIRGYIKEGMISKGMTEEQVKGAWGDPCYSCEGTTLIGKTKSLDYSTRIIFFNEQGRVTEWVIK